MSLLAAGEGIPHRERSWEKDLPCLMARYQAGEAEAIDELMRLLSPMMLQYFRAHGGNAHDADDLFQECWLRIHKSRAAYRPPEPVLPWIFAIARYTGLDEFRRLRRREAREISYAEPPEVSATQHEGDEAVELEQLLASLPEGQREVIVMLKISGMSLEEVARATASTVGSIKQKAHRAYERLRVVLQKERA